MMRPALLVARKDLLEHLLSVRFHVCAAMMAVLLGLSVFVMCRDYRVRMDSFAVLQARATPRAGESGVMAVVRPRPLSIFARGLDELMNRGYDVTAYNGITPHDRQTPSASLVAFFPPPDLLYLVKALLSLVALLLSYDAVSGEKEKGTLRLILSSPVSRGQIVAGKMIGGLTAVMVPFLLVLAALVVALVVAGQVDLVPDDGWRLLVMLVAATCYVTIFFAFGVLVSARSGSSPRALVVLLFVWVVLVFAWPNVGHLVAARLSPVPAADTQEALRTQAFARNRFVAIQSHGRDPEGSLEAFNRDYDRLAEQYRARLGQLVDTSRRLSRVSPAACLTYVFTDAAGTGIGDFRRLNDQLMAFKAANLPALMIQGDSAAPLPPPFHFTPRNIGEAWRQGVLIDLSLLAVTAALLFATAAVAAVGTDPR